MSMKRREFLAAGLALPLSSALALAQQRGATPTRAGRAGGGGGRGAAAVPVRTAKTTKMFKSPGLYPNALAVMTDAPGGLWIGQQKAAPQNPGANQKLETNLPQGCDGVVDEPGGRHHGHGAK